MITREFEFDFRTTSVVLKQLGYNVVFREHGWTECLISGAREGWTGAGLEAEGAFQDAVLRMFPSVAARHLLGREVCPAVPSPEAETSVGKPLLVGEPPVVPSSVAKRSIELEPKADVGAIPGTVGPELKAIGGSSLFAKSAAGSAVPACVKAERSMASPTRVADAERGLRLKPASAFMALAELRELHERVLAHRPDIALMAPRLQRLHLLAWAAKARTFDELLPDDEQLPRAVGKVMSALGEMARVYWPGMVKALRLTADPADCFDQLPTAPALHSWSDVAREAANEIERHAARALDDFGWADETRLAPVPCDPDQILEEVTATLDRLGAMPFERDQLDDATRAALNEVAVRLRAIRGSSCDAEDWGSAMGRVRRLAWDSRAVGGALGRLLDPEYSPPQAWSAQLELGRRLQLGEGPRLDALATSPRVGATEAEVTSWICRAVEAGLTNGEVAAQLSPVRELALTVDPRLMESRRLRRRFGKILEVLSGDSPSRIENRIPQQVSVPTMATVVSSPSLTDLAHAAALTHTSGKVVLFVSNREDPELRERLEATFECRIDWCVAEPRRVQAQADSIRHGSYDLVLSATGFQAHAVDRAIRDACRSVSVPFVRVDHGRPLACERAIVRDLGGGGNATSTRKGSAQAVRGAT